MNNQSLYFSDIITIVYLLIPYHGSPILCINPKLFIFLPSLYIYHEKNFIPAHTVFGIEHVINSIYFNELKDLLCYNSPKLSEHVQCMTKLQYYVTVSVKSTYPRCDLFHTCHNQK